MIESGNRDTKRKGNCGRKGRTTACDDAFHIIIRVKDPKKINVDLQTDLAAAGVTVRDSRVRQRLLEVGSKTRNPLRKQLVTPLMMGKQLP